MMRTLTFATALLSLGGCVVYDKPCDDDGFWSDDDGDVGQQDDGGQDEDPALGIVLSPDTLAQGQTAIVSFQAQVDFDWYSVTDVVVYGDVVPCAMQARADELLVTLSVDPDAELGALDLVIETDDGQAVFVNDALFIIERGGSEDGSGTGSEDGSEDGTEDGSEDGSEEGSEDGSSAGGC